MDSVSNRIQLRIFLDTSGHDDWHTQQLLLLKDTLSKSVSSDAILVANPEYSDCILKINNCPSILGSDCLRWDGRKSPPEFFWDMGDLPTGGLPGLYVSLPTYMYDRRRHRAFCLPIIMNETVHEYDLSDAQYLFGYLGSTSSGLRQRLNIIMQPYHVGGKARYEVRDQIWDKMFDRSGLQAKVDYANNLRQCRFILCPRGAVLGGVGSRLYETMQAARVPVIISDRVVLPEGIDWQACSVRIRERDISKIPQILADYDDNWQVMARSARLAYENHFCPSAILGELGRQLRALLISTANESEFSKYNFLIRLTFGKISLQARQSYGKIRNAVAFR